MKFNILLSIFFIIVTTFSAVHELEHLSQQDKTSSCPICIVDDHLVSADLPQTYKEPFYSSFPQLLEKEEKRNFHLKKSSNHSTAPPKAT